jgi:hypothetical protein
MKFFNKRRPKVQEPHDEFQTTKQATKASAIVLNLEEFIEKQSLAKGKYFSTNKMSLATNTRQGDNLDDLSLALIDITDTNEDEQSLKLERLQGDGEESTAADSAAFSESANSSANFSFTNESCENVDSYPSLYAPEKQQEYEAMKVIQERKERYGVLHPFAGFIELFYTGGKKIYNSVSSYTKRVDFDKFCAA